MPLCLHCLAVSSEQREHLQSLPLALLVQHQNYNSLTRCLWPRPRYRATLFVHISHNIVAVSCPVPTWAVFTTWDAENAICSISIHFFSLLPRSRGRCSNKLYRPYELTHWLVWRFSRFSFGVIYKKIKNLNRYPDWNSSGSPLKGYTKIQESHAVVSRKKGKNVREKGS